MDNDAMLQQLLDACDAGRRDAMALARRTDSEALRALLRESALQYAHAADEIRAAWRGHPEPRRRPERRGARAEAPGEDLVALWEGIEGETLTYFRDAYDSMLSPELAETVRRHLEAGIRRLEQLRQLHAFDA